MSFQLVTIRSADFDDPTMYPVLGNGTVIAFEPLDGPAPQRLIATQVQVHELRGSGLATLARFRRIRAEVFVTEGRVAVACRKYEKGGGWLSTSITGMVLFNAVSYARAAIRSRGKALVGHVRYPWLKAVGFAPRCGRGTHDTLRLVVEEEDQGRRRTLFLDLGLQSNFDAASAALLIAQSCARYALAHDVASSSSREGFAALVHASPLAPVPTQFVFYMMPTSHCASRDTAYPPTGSPATTVDADNRVPSKLNDVWAPVATAHRADAPALPSGIATACGTATGRQADQAPRAFTGFGRHLDVADPDSALPSSTVTGTVPGAVPSRPPTPDPIRRIGGFRRPVSALDAASSPHLQQANDHPLPARLVVMNGDQAGTDLRLVATPLTIGRDPGCDLPLFDETVSRRHGRLDLVDGALVYEDLGSANGSLCNGRAATRVVMSEGDRLRVGKTVLLLKAATSRARAD
jgi:hypothetical protein